jgi:hypothetical protein
MKTVVIGIDPATSTGLSAFVVDPVTKTYDIVAFSQYTYDGAKDDYGSRLEWFANVLINFIDAITVIVQHGGTERIKQRLYIERSHHRGAAATRYGYGYDAIAYLLTNAANKLDDLDAKCTRVHTGTLKKYATGTGNATKEQMIGAAWEELSARRRRAVIMPTGSGSYIGSDEIDENPNPEISKDVVTDNVADSYFLAKYGAECILAEMTPPEGVN